MKPKREWREWLEAQIARFQTARRLAEALGLDEAAITRWRRYGFLPQSTDVERLATVTGTPLLELLVMLWAADRDRLEARARPPMGVTGSSGAPSAKPAAPTGRSRRRGSRLAGLLLAATSLLAALAAPRVALADYPLGVGPDSVGIPLIGPWRRWRAHALVPALV